MYTHWHTRQNEYTKIVLKHGMATVEAEWRAPSLIKGPRTRRYRDVPI